jgi:hypothetical protein
MKFSIVPVALLSVVTALLLAPVAQAEPSEKGASDSKASTTIVLFSENRGIARIENNQPGTDHGDLVHRELALSKTRKGPVIGVSYTQATVVAYNPVAKVDVRRVDIERQLPGGWLFSRGMSKLPIGSVPQPGWSDTYAVIGGTGKYAGARGYERLLLLEDGVTFKLTITLLK